MFRGFLLIDNQDIPRAGRSQQTSLNTSTVQAAIKELKQHGEIEVGFMLVRRICSRFASSTMLDAAAVLAIQPEGNRKEIGDRGLIEGSVLFWKEDDGAGSTEFEDGLAASTAGLAGSVVEVGDGDGADADAGAVEAYGCSDGGLLGAGGEAVGGVFNVAAGDDGAVFEQDGCAYAEVTVRSIGVLGGSGSLLLELLDQVG
jgi:hypothetical protein